ncbi:MAG: PLP-dependent aminotransferase family protein [Proteobacteria bacterium]|nr:PLP-dependent aminotransferase family protein [Pseudomonadota bacterium]
MDPILGLALDPAPPGSRRRRDSLYRQLRTAILDGRLRAGLRLPATRALATSLGVSRNTVVAAYERLLGEGYVSARRGAGTVVAALAGRARRRPPPPLTTASPPGAPPGAEPVRFRLGVPDTASFPQALWQRLGGRAARRLIAGPAPHADPQGLPALRAAIAGHVSFARAVACDPDDVIVTAGAQQAFDLIGRALVTPRLPVAVEEPGYPPLRAALSAHGARLLPVPVDAEGLVVAALPRRARLVCVTPSHQFPLGPVLSAPRRAALLEHARRHGALVVEDDYDGEFRFADRPLDALQTLDRDGSVLYVGTFSKSLLPELRLGYLVVPRRLRAALVAAKAAATGAGPWLAEATLAALIAEGHLARHVRRMQRLYARRRERLLEGLTGPLAAHLEVLPSVAGLHVAARLRHGREAAVVAAAARAGVAVAPLGVHYAATPPVAGLLFGYGNLDEAGIAEGLQRLGTVLAGR